VFTAGVTLLLSTATVFFRDVRHLTEVLLQVLLYLSPVLYDIGQLGEHQSWWFRVFRFELRVNPMSYLLPLVRDPVYYGRFPPLHVVAVAVAYAVASVAIGFTVFTHFERRHIHHF
jgi:ABC-type polysaccharide/polyol phosphate export permease